MFKVVEEYINVNETQSVMKQVLTRYRLLTMITPERHAPSTTQSFSGIPAATNRKLNGIEAAADKNIRQEQMLKEREQQKVLIDEAVSYLDEDERYIIEENILKHEKVPDVLIYTDLHIGKTAYYRMKKQALIKLAFSLGLEVYKD